MAMFARKLSQQRNRRINHTLNSSSSSSSLIPIRRSMPVVIQNSPKFITQSPNRQHRSDDLKRSKSDPTTSEVLIDGEEHDDWMSKEEVEDQMIMWPPVVIVQNTRSYLDDNGKWVGVSKPKLCSFYRNYNIKKVKSAYGPDGHCGISLLIFESSARGYVEAERLHGQFLINGRGKYEWKNHRDVTHSAEKCLFYGYMPTEGDMELFNKHSKGNQKHKFEKKSYKVMVVDPLTKREDNDVKLIELETQVARKKKENQILMENCYEIGQKLQSRKLEIEIIRRRALEELEESKKETAYLEKYYADTIKQLTGDYAKIKMMQREMQKSFNMLPNGSKKARSVA